MGPVAAALDLTPYISFSGEEWAALRANTPLTLTQDDIERLRGINDQLSLEEVERIYLPLSRLLNFYVGATQGLYRARQAFLGDATAKVPFVVGIAGSVAVGKSTTARVLRELLARWPNHPKVDLVTTDGFLYPNRVLQARGLMERKGFPESYDQRRLLQFVHDVKSGMPEVEAPVYSHINYDIVYGEYQKVRQPDIMIIEGLNVLQIGPTPRAAEAPRVFVSDYFDFSVYVDAKAGFIQQWYIKRFLTLRRTAFRQPNAYFHRYANLSDQEAMATARRIWTTINGKNLRENILPTRSRAALILEKGPDHRIERVHLRKI
ncbi:MAG: type I pantothenate kinase [Vicinamibacteraceae bacterium]|nr:type I pantothenate kinase [Vicinamibacteraceae bacterium]